MNEKTCYHCGDATEDEIVIFEDKNFCCHGCKMVYQILKDGGLTAYYDFEKTPGLTPNEIEDKYHFLSNPEVVEKLLEFKEADVEIVTLYIPKIHCSSCVWVLENLDKLNTNINNSRVQFAKKTVQITYNSKTNLQELVTLLAKIGYDPYISLQDNQKNQPKTKHSIYKLGIAGFAFGNSMFLSIPDYFGTTDIWFVTYQPLFVFLLFIFSLPVVFYAGNDYLISAYKGIKQGILNIDVPISIGVLVLFLRSCYDYFSGNGQGYFDSLCGLIFFLLLGKFFQKKTYDFLSFERDFKSYFPIAVAKLSDDVETAIPVNEIEKGDVLLIRNEEIIPVDGILLSNNALIDYSFVTGEERLIPKKEDEKIFAGGKQKGQSIKMRVTKKVSQSYLTRLWGNQTSITQNSIQNITDIISRYFTWGLLSITCIAALYWLFVDSSKIINVVTSVLIVACPCALALSVPFALGNMIRILGKKGCYLKEGNILEKMAKVNTIYIDKTGTITTRKKQNFEYVGDVLKPEDLRAIKSLVRNSNHPLSRGLFQYIVADKIKPFSFLEIEGKGIEGEVNNSIYKIGSATFAGLTKPSDINETRIYIVINNKNVGYFEVKHTYRNSIFETLKKIAQNFNLHFISGDNDSALSYLKSKLPKSVNYYFTQTPFDKLSKIKESQNKGNVVMMIGDGLNDAGALLQADVGIAVSEDVNVFSPASDVILDAKQLVNLPSFLGVAKKTILIVKISFILSILYNLIGLYFAISGKLTPLISAILMPLSSITIVGFVTMTTNILAYLSLKKPN